MAKAKTRFVCQSCGAIHPRWVGHCDDCDAWNSIVEEAPTETAPIGGKVGAKAFAAGGKPIDFVNLEGNSDGAPRRVTGMNEFDRVTGGGLVEGSAILIGGDPGIGKSTVLLQVTAALAKEARCIYISGEEAVDQIRLRASRLGVATQPVELATATNVGNILATLDSDDRPDVVVIDSIQTMYIEGLESAPGTVAQIRASAQELIRLAKRRGFALLLVGHVTKEGAIAGPRVLEHMVDTVLYFEGDRGHQFRILRSVKNRFGATDEIGVFEMTDKGLAEVANPSALFLADRQGEVSGAAVFAGIEGSRPMLVEIQALVAPSSLATPRRAVVGWDSARLSMTLAVLEARCGLQFGGNDVYLNVAGGLRISEPAADLAVAAALISSLTGEPMPENMIVFGEIGLSGEVRPVGQAEARLKEAEKLGFGAALTPTQSRKKGRKSSDQPLQVTEINHLRGLVERFGSANLNIRAIGE
ncbi:MAG TPA: DNA repair protein RadA [Rhodospirillaceae bacterium]|nr:DNA repair protein RadA [Rhodospirillaceae bacterium]HAA91755.1 DNA repair protein RadA [Rhodospirillaceae bacterium]HAT34348.1 DNA repair protein RadA [Rhodospirillaceae bacterium]